MLSITLDSVYIPWVNLSTVGVSNLSGRQYNFEDISEQPGLKSDL